MKKDDLIPLIGKRIILVETKDDFTDLVPGDTGIITNICDAPNIHVKWDNGSTLALIPNVDIYKIKYYDLTVTCIKLLWATMITNIKCPDDKYIEKFLMKTDGSDTIEKIISTLKMQVIKDNNIYLIENIKNELQSKRYSYVQMPSDTYIKDFITSRDFSNTALSVIINLLIDKICSENSFEINE